MLLSSLVPGFSFQELRRTLSTHMTAAEIFEAAARWLRRLEQAVNLRLHVYEEDDQSEEDDWPEEVCQVRETHIPRQDIMRNECSSRSYDKCDFQPRYDTRPITEPAALAAYESIISNQNMGDEDVMAMLCTRTYLGDVCATCGAVANPSLELTSPGVVRNSTGEPE
jgi:hypothetical protein